MNMRIVSLFHTESRLLPLARYRVPTLIIYKIVGTSYRALGAPNNHRWTSTKSYIYYGIIIIIIIIIE